MTDTESRVREIVARIAELPTDISAEANLYLDLGVASVHAMHLLLELEERFEVSVPDEDFVEATSVALLAKMVDRLRSEQVGEGDRA